MLYALRYEKHGSNALTELLQILLEQGLIEQQVKVSFFHTNTHNSFKVSI